MKCSCLKCGHEWLSKVAVPKCCPSCCNPKWQEKRAKPKSSLYRRTLDCWNDMMDRCHGTGGHAKHRYKDRGITVCEQWHTFKNFLSDMGIKPDGMQLDRIDNNGGYSKENCRWVTSRENNNNRCNNTILTFNGEQSTLAQLARRHGLQPRMLSVRLNRGWTLNRALTQKPRGRNADI